MKKITLLLLLCLAFSVNSYGQCTTNTGGQWPSTAVNLANSGGVESIVANNWPNAEFSIIENVLPGSDYTVAASPSLYITVTNTANNAVITHGAGSVSFTAGAGVTGLTIYWHADAACGTVAAGDTATTIQCTTCSCSATAAPEAVTTPTPADGADVVLVGGGTSFAWEESLTGDSAESFTISIGTTIAANEIGTLANATSGNTVTFGGVANTTYYWKIDAINCFGSTTSAVWSFNAIDCPETAAPACPTLITPADGEIAAATSDDGSGTGSVNISWSPISGVSSYEITFDGAVLGTTALTSINITGLDLSTEYTWSIAPSNCFGTATGCATWSFTTDDALLSINENVLTTFSVYPNPTANVLNIKSTQEIDNVTVFNLLGQNVASFSKNEITNSSIDMSELSKGLYLVKITSGDKTQTLRVTKE